MSVISTAPFEVQSVGDGASAVIMSFVTMHLTLRVCVPPLHSTEHSPHLPVVHCVGHTAVPHVFSFAGSVFVAPLQNESEILTVVAPVRALHELPVRVCLPPPQSVLQTE